jgi:hypothetical protein
VVAFRDENDDTLYRRDADKNEIASMMNDPGQILQNMERFSNNKATKVLGCLAIFSIKKVGVIGLRDNLILVKM